MTVIGNLFRGFWAGGLEGFFESLTGLTQQTASATSYVHWASEGFGLCIGSMSFLGSSTYTCFGSTNPEIGARLEPVAPKTRRCILERFIFETSVVVEFQRKTANVRNHLGQRGRRNSIYSEVSRLENGSIVGVEVRRTRRRPNRHGNAAKAPRRRCRDDFGRARCAWNCSMQSVKNAAMARSVPHAIEFLLLRHGKKV